MVAPLAVVNGGPSEEATFGPDGEEPAREDLGEQGPGWRDQEEPGA